MKLTRIDLSDVPTPEVFADLRNRLNLWFERELGFNATDHVQEVRVIELEEEESKKGSTPYTYFISVYELGLDVQLTFVPLLSKRVESRKVIQHPAGDFTQEIKTIRQWRMDVVASTSAWSTLEPASMGWAHLTLLNHLASFRLSGFDFEIKTEKEKNDEDEQILVKKYKIVKRFSALVDDFVAKENTSHIIWALGAGCPYFLLDGHIDITPEVQTLLGSKALVKFQVPDPTRGHRIRDLELTSITASHNLHVWHDLLSVNCPFTHNYLLGGYIENTDAILFWDDHLVGNRDLCAGCAEEFKCIAKDYKDGGYKLTYPISQLGLKPLAS